MRPEDRDPGYVWDMLDAVRTILSFTTGVTLESRGTGANYSKLVSFSASKSYSTTRSSFEFGPRTGRSVMRAQPICRAMAAGTGCAKKNQA